MAQNSTTWRRTQRGAEWRRTARHGAERNAAQNGAEQHDMAQNATRRRMAQSGEWDSKARDGFIALAAQSASRSGMLTRLAACGFPRLFAFAFFRACIVLFLFLLECLPAFIKPDKLKQLTGLYQRGNALIL